MYKHVCSFCFTIASKAFQNTELECRNKKKCASKTRKLGISHFGTCAPRSSHVFNCCAKK